MLKFLRFADFMARGNLRQIKTQAMENSKIPSVQGREGLKKISNDFKPENVRVLPALNSDPSLESCIDGVTGAVRRLMRFIDNGNTDENLDFRYKSVRHFA